MIAPTSAALISSRRVGSAPVRSTVAPADPSAHSRADLAARYRRLGSSLTSCGAVRRGAITRRDKHPRVQARWSGRPYKDGHVVTEQTQFRFVRQDGVTKDRRGELAVLF